MNQSQTSVVQQAETVSVYKALSRSRVAKLLRKLHDKHYPTQHILNELLRGIPGMTDPEPTEGEVAMKVALLRIEFAPLAKSRKWNVDNLNKIQSYQTPSIEVTEE